MTDTGTAVAVARPLEAKPLANAALSTWSTEANFALAMRAAKALSSSDLVPEAYKGKEANCLIALDIASHLAISPLTVMQNLHIIHGRPSWGSSFVIGALNSCGRFSPLRFEITRRGLKKVEITFSTGPRGQRTTSRETREIEDVECYAYTRELATGERIEGPAVSLEMAHREGWTAKAESKWLTMPDLMLRYRAAAFFGRLYAPDILMGMQTVEEVVDVAERAPVTATARTGGASALQDAIDAAKAEAPAQPPAPTPAAATKPAEEIADAVVEDSPKPAPDDVPEMFRDPAPTPAPKAAPAPARPTTPARPEPSATLRALMKHEESGGYLTDDELEDIRQHRLTVIEWDSKFGGKA